jgi:hypothetical protein
MTVQPVIARGILALRVIGARRGISVAGDFKRADRRGDFCRCMCYNLVGKEAT